MLTTRLSLLCHHEFHELQALNLRPFDCPCTHRKLPSIFQSLKLFLCLQYRLRALSQSVSYISEHYHHTLLALVSQQCIGLEFLGN